MNLESEEIIEALPKDKVQDILEELLQKLNPFQI